MRSARAIAQPGVGLTLVARNPLSHRAFAHADGWGHAGGPLLAGEHAAHNLCSTTGAAPGILMNVHSGLLHRGDGRLTTTSSQ
jgi:hypothetical protein